MPPRQRPGITARPALRSALTLFDQAVSSAQNFALVVLVARSVSPSAFGAFSLGLALLLFLVGLSQALISEPLLLRHAGGDAPGRRQAMGVASTASGAFSFGACLLLLLGALLASGGSSGRTLLACAACVLPLVATDLTRMLSVAVGRPVLLIVIDVTWIATWSAVVLVAQPAGAQAHLLAWGLSSSTAALLGMLGLHLRPARPAQAAALWREETLRDARSLLGDFFALTATAQMGTLIVASVASLAAAGALRAVQTLFGPLNILVNASRTAIVPEIIRSGGSRSPRGRRFLSVVTTAAVTVTACLGSVLLLLPPRWGHALLGDTWPAAVPLLLPLTLSRLLGALTLYPMVALRADRHLSAAARTRTESAVVVLLATAAAALTVSVRGIAWAQVGAAVVTLLLFLRALQRARGAEPGRTATTRPVTEGAR